MSGILTFMGRMHTSTSTSYQTKMHIVDMKQVISVVRYYQPTIEKDEMRIIIDDRKKPCDSISYTVDKSEINTIWKEIEKWKNINK